MLTWGVCKRENTATVFCMQCRAVFGTVAIGDTHSEMERVKYSHFCTPDKPWNRRPKKPA